MTSKKLKDDGIYLTKYKNHDLDIALISLVIGFEAYYSTYQSVKRFLNVVETRPNNTWDDDGFNGTDEKFFDGIHILNYAKAETNFTKAYIKTIFHFHHFIEISIKEILRQEHELLASVAGRKHAILHKLLKGDKVTVDERGSLNSLASREATERITELINEQRIKNHENMKFIVEAKFLKEIDELRNRLAHRGTFMLRYTDLDIFVGKNIFPFILKLLDLPIYKGNKLQWQPKQLYCQIDPIQKIINECGVSKPNFSKIAFLKEMGRAAYKNPLLPKQKMRQDNRKEVMEERAKKELDIDNNVADVIECPVCSANTLVRYWDINPNDETQEISTLSCICCSFKIDSELNKINLKGFDIKSLWQWD